MLKHQCPGISHLSRDINLYPSLFHVHHTAWRAALPAAAVGSSPPADETIVQAIQLCLARALALAQGRCATARLSSYGSSIRPVSRGGANLERVGEADDDLQMRVARSYVRLKPSRAQNSPQYRHRRGRGGKIDVDRTVLRCHDWARVLRRKDPRLSRRVSVVDEYSVKYCPFVLSSCCGLEALCAIRPEKDSANPPTMSESRLGRSCPPSSCPVSREWVLAMAPG